MLRKLYFPGEEFSAVLRAFSSFFSSPSRHQHWNTGTTNMVIDWINMPPKVGIAIGTMMSAPFPVEVRTGSRAIRVVAVVMAAGRTRLRPAVTTASRMSCLVCGFFSRKT